MPAIIPVSLDVQTSEILDNRCAGPSTANSSIVYKAPGLLRYETDNDTWKYWDGSNYVDLVESPVVTLTGGGSTTISGTHPNFTVSSTDTIGALTDVAITSAAAGDLLKYDSSTASWTNVSPTYLDGAGIYSSYLVKVVNGVAEHTSFAETVSNTFTRLQTSIPLGVVSVIAGSIESELYQTTKTRMVLTSRGKASGDGIAITSDGNVGIGVLEPRDKLEIKDSMRIYSGIGPSRLKFDRSGTQLSEIHSDLDSSNGGALQFFTKNNGGIISEKLRINNQGAFGIEGANFGNSGQVLTSNGSGNPVSWADQIDTTYAQGTGISIVGTTINNTAPDQTVSLTQGGATTITGSYPNFTISSTDTTYTTGSNMSLVGTQFNIPQSVATTATPTFAHVKSPGVYNSGGGVDIGPLSYAYPRFRVGGGNGAHEAYLSNVMNGAYYFRIRGHPSGQGQMYFNSSATISCNTSFSPASDDRLKHNETTITKALHLIRQLVPKKYEKTETMLPADYKGTLPKGMNYVIEAGFIAQEVKKIPDLSFAVNGGDYEDEKDDGTKELKAHPFNLNYDTIFTYVTAAVQELDGVVQQQAVLIKSLQARIEALESLINLDIHL